MGREWGSWLNDLDLPHHLIEPSKVEAPQAASHILTTGCALYVA